MSEHTPESIEERFTYLLSLEEGWLDGNGKAIAPRSIHRAREFIRVTGVKGFSIFPREEGYVALEWIDIGSKTFVEIEFSGDEENRGDELWVLP